MDIINQADYQRDIKGNIKESIRLIEDNIGQLRKKENILLSIYLPLFLRKLGNFYRDIGNTDKAYELYNEALAVAQNDLNKIEEADINTALAFLELKTGSIDTALKYAKSAYGYIGKKRGKKFGEARANTYAVLGNIYFEIGNYKKALVYYRKGLETAELCNLEKRVITLSGDVANVYLKQGPGMLAKAEIILKENIVRAEKSYLVAVPQMYLRLAKIYSIKYEDFKEAKENVLKGLEYAEKYNLKRDIAECNEALGDLYYQSQSPECDRYFGEAARIYEEGGYERQAYEVSKKIRD